VQDGGLPVGRVQVARLRAQVLLQEALLSRHHGPAGRPGHPGKRFLVAIAWTPAAAGRCYRVAFASVVTALASFRVFCYVPVSCTPAHFVSTSCGSLCNMFWPATWKWE
jgi:hypothetical protein